HVAAGSKSLRVVYQANFTPGSAYRFQYRLAAPSDLVIERVSVNSADEQIDTRWTRDADGHLSIFFGSEAVTDSRLMLTGHIPLVAGARVVLARITAASTASTTQQVQLYRDDDVKVDLSGLPAAEESNAGPNDLPPVEWLVRPIGVYHLDDAAAKTAPIAGAASQPRLTGDTLTPLTRWSDSWWASFRCRLVVEKGDVDSLRLRVPENWTGPFDVESSLSISTSILPRDEHSRTLGLRFASTVAEGATVDVR